MIIPSSSSKCPKGAKGRIVLLIFVFMVVIPLVGKLITDFPEVYLGSPVPAQRVRGENTTIGQDFRNGMKAAIWQSMPQLPQAMEQISPTQYAVMAAVLGLAAVGGFIRMHNRNQVNSSIVLRGEKLQSGSAQNIVPHPGLDSYDGTESQSRS